MSIASPSSLRGSFTPAGDIESMLAAPARSWAADSGVTAPAVSRYCADLLLVSAPETGDPEDTAVARAACAAARQAGVPVVARTGPGATGAWMIDLGADAAIARAIQKSAAAAHQSQSQALPELARRLDLLNGRESLRWLVPPSATAEQGTTIPAAPASA